MPDDIKPQVSQLDGKVQTLVDLTKDVLKGVTSIGERTIRLETNQEAMGKTIDTVHKAVYEGNGTPPIMQRLTVLETTVGSLTKDVQDVVTGLDGVKNGKLLSRNQIIAGFLSLLTTAVLALGAILAQLFK